MDLSTDENSEYLRIAAVLKEIGKESLLNVFKHNELTDVVLLDCLETEERMRSELKDVNISVGSVLRFTKAWFSHIYKDSGTVTEKNVPTININRQSAHEGAIVSQHVHEEQRKHPQNSSHLKTEEHNNESISHEVASASSREKQKSQNFKKNAPKKQKTNSKNVENDVGATLLTTAEEKTVPVENASQKKSVDINDDITKTKSTTMEPPSSTKPNDSQKREKKSTVDVNDNVEETKSFKFTGMEPPPQSTTNDSQKGEKNSSKTKSPANRDVKELRNPKSSVWKYCNRRQFGQPEGNSQYEKGAVFPIAENEQNEFKALTQEKPEKLPWKIMEKARVFICAVLNTCQSAGTIYFGIGDAIDKATNFKHGEIVGLEVENLRDDINKAFQSILDDHIKSDQGKLTSAEMKAVKIHYVPVTQSNEKTSSYVVEIDVQRDWRSCKDHVYYIVDKWDESEKWKKTEKYGLHELYKVKKGNDEQVYIRTCGASQSVKSSDINTQIKEPLSQAYEDWKAEETKRHLPSQFKQEIASMPDMQTLSQDLQESLQKLCQDNDYILIASKVPQQYRGSNDLSFLKSIPWFCVFDLFDQNSQTDGLSYILNETNDSARVTVINLGDFNEPPTNFSKHVTTWILRDQMMHENDWTTYSKNSLIKALSTCYEETLARKHWVFLCLSDECLEEMTDVIDLLFTIIGKEANKCITIISEKKEIGKKIIRPLKIPIQNDLKYTRSIFEMPLDLLKKNVQQMLGPNNFKDSKATTDLPYITGLKPVLNKRINNLTDLEIYCPNPSITSSPGDIKKARGDFYKGDTIQQLNLFHKHDIPRTLQEKLTRQINSRIDKLSNPYDQDYTGFVETVNVSYEPGSGATTLCRRILWDKRKKIRCAVVKTIETDTDRQISELQKFAYENGSAYIPPVLILVDKFPEQVLRLIDKLSEKKTKCVLLNTIPITNVAMGNKDDNVQLGLLDDSEIELVKNVLSDVEVKDEGKIRAAEETLKRERKFMWLGLELFGREYSKIEDRLSEHIENIMRADGITSQLRDAYQIILHFCCFLDYYSNGQFIYPHACVLEILRANFGLDEECPDKIAYIHKTFGGLLLEDHSEAGGYRGWRLAHFLVGEIIRTKMDLVVTVKNFFEKHRLLYINKTQAKKNLIKNVVHTCLQRESIYTNSSTSEDDPDLVIEEEDDLGEKQKYSKLLLQVMPHESESEVTNALDILISINENVETDEQKARSSQQLARVLAYEIGEKTISKKDVSHLSKLSLSCIDQVSENSRTSGFEVAHEVIDRAVELQPNNVHHLVTKGTLFKTELHSKLLKTNHPDFASGRLKEFVKEAMAISREGISRYDRALEKTAYDDRYLYAMIGKIQTIIILLEIFKNLPCFSVGEPTPDESFKMFMTFGKYPKELNSILSEKKDLNDFLSLRITPSQLLDELFEAIEERKQLIKKHKMQKIKTATKRAAFLRKKFYDVTKLDRTPLASNNLVSKEDIVQDILYKHDETPFSGWKKLTSAATNQIYEYTKQDIAKGSTNDRVMLLHAKAALKTNSVTLRDLLEHVKNWCEKRPTSKWANLFNYMIKFPVPNGSLNANVPAVNESIQICKSKSRCPPYECRKSSAEYFLGKGLGIKAILPSYEFEDSSRKQEMKSVNNGRSGDVRDTEFWRSQDVYKKLERLCGQKVLGKRGVLDYKGVEIMFNNEIYPKESRDDLWFCLGFTLYGPYAYDPVDKETFDAIKKGFSDEKPRFCPLKASDKVSKPATPTLPALLSSSSTMARAQNRSLRPDKEVQSRVQNEDEWKTNDKLTLRRRVGDGHQISFEPKQVDFKGRVMHGAQVIGASKSIICNRPSERCSAGTCTFAHPMNGDFIRQTVCWLCTTKNKDSCNEKIKHKKYIYDLGRFYNRYGQYWKQRFSPECTSTKELTHEHPDVH